jgi:hypothetical protein
VDGRPVSGQRSGTGQGFLAGADGLEARKHAGIARTSGIVAPRSSRRPHPAWVMPAVVALQMIGSWPHRLSCSTSW